MEKIRQDNNKILARLPETKKTSSSLKSILSTNSKTSIYSANLLNSYKIRRARGQREIEDQNQKNYLSNLSKASERIRARRQQEIEKENKKNAEILKNVKSSMFKYDNSGAMGQAQILSNNRKAKLESSSLSIANLNFGQRFSQRLQNRSSNSATKKLPTRATNSTDRIKKFRSI